MPVSRGLQHQINVPKAGGIHGGDVQISVLVFGLVHEHGAQHFVPLLNDHTAVVRAIDADDKIAGPLKGEAVVFAIGAARFGRRVDGDVQRIPGRVKVLGLYIEIEEFFNSMGR